jgi:uncharacterized protein
MRIEFDPEKSERNVRERGLSFTAAARFDFETATFKEDRRRDYGERRIVGIGYLDGRLHFLCFKPLGPPHIRVISFRKANMKERKRYEKEQTKKYQTADR